MAAVADASAPSVTSASSTATVVLVAVGASSDLGRRRVAADATADAAAVVRVVRWVRLVGLRRAARLAEPAVGVEVVFDVAVTIGSTTSDVDVTRY